MENQIKLAYVDFCHTVVTKYTLGDYIRFYLLEKKKFLSYFLFRFKLLSIENILIHIFNNQDISIAKKYAESLDKHINFDVIKLLKNLIDNDFKIVIVSAGIEVYIKPFFERQNIEIYNYLTTNNDPIYQYLYGKQKIKAIKTFEMDMSISTRVGISDHISDMPMLEYCQRKIAVKGGNKSLYNFAKLNNWEVIE